jgi:hypothetical protein
LRSRQGIWAAESAPLRNAEPAWYRVCRVRNSDCLRVSGLLCSLFLENRGLLKVIDSKGLVWRRGESNKSGVLKTRNLLKNRGAQSARIWQSAPNWNVTGTSPFVCHPRISPTGVWRWRNRKHGEITPDICSPSAERGPVVRNRDRGCVSGVGNDGCWGAFRCSSGGNVDFSLPPGPVVCACLFK